MRFSMSTLPPRTLSSLLECPMVSAFMLISLSSRTNLACCRKREGKLMTLKDLDSA